MYFWTSTACKLSTSNTTSPFTPSNVLSFKVAVVAPSAFAAEGDAVPARSAAEALAAEASAARLESAFCSLRETKRANARVEFERAIHREMEGEREKENG